MGALEAGYRGRFGFIVEGDGLGGWRFVGGSDGNPVGHTTAHDMVHVVDDTPTINGLSWAQTFRVVIDGGRVVAALR